MYCVVPTGHRLPALAPPAAAPTTAIAGRWAYALDRVDVHCAGVCALVHVQVRALRQEPRRTVG